MNIRELLDRAESAPGPSGGYGEIVTTFVAVTLVAHRLASILRDVKPDIVAGVSAWRERLEQDARSGYTHEELVTAVADLQRVYVDLRSALDEIQSDPEE